MSTFEPFKIKKYVGIAKEPVYVGTGGYRIGRVDNTIIRDAGTGLPKVSGSTISGNARYYSWLSHKSEGMNLNIACAKGKTTVDERGDKQEACGDCPVCLSYGFINNNKAHSGLAYFSDARILFFPVATMIGTVWVTSDEILKEFVERGGDNNIEAGEGEFLVSDSLESDLPEASGNKVLNFGWIMLTKKESTINPENWRIKNDDGAQVVDLSEIVKELNNKICVVNSKTFYHIVNSNLETRTSVSINPITGAAEGGALFTYEALPRGTVFIFDITYENPKNYMLSKDIAKVIGTVEKGLKLFSTLGIGGMGTRGFGKIEVKDNWFDEEKYWEKIKEFFDKLKEDINSLKNEITKKNEITNFQEGDDANKKDELKKKCQKFENLAKKIKLWKKYIEEKKEILNKEKKQNKEILKKMDEIDLGIDISIPKKCVSEEGKDE